MFGRFYRKITGVLIKLLNKSVAQSGAGWWFKFRVSLQRRASAPWPLRLPLVALAQYAQAVQFGQFVGTAAKVGKHFVGMFAQARCG